MISHVVMLGLSGDYDGDALAQIMTELGKLVGVIPGFARFDHGPNRDFEGKSPGFPYGFICQFSNATALSTYATDPRHQSLGARLVTLCGGDADNILVYDIEN
ncbi:Dabb family protein [Loktanella agnita]|uniref:Dabb family protein n=1 Tax=Loktanella agnita TaxID=287097 RepID=UPI0039863DC5